MRRREFIGLLGGAAAVAWPHAASAQRSRKLWRVGFLAGGSRPVAFDSSVYAGFIRGMRELGYSEGIDFVIEWRFAEGRFALFPQLAGELVRANVDVIVLATGAAVRPTQHATSTIPIVMGYSVDPVGDGYVSSLARPGGNTTGLSADETTPKRVGLIAAMVPSLRRLGILVNPDNPSSAIVLKAARAAAEQGGLDLAPVQVKNRDEVTRAFDTLIDASVQALVVPSDAFFFSERHRIAELLVQKRLPAIFADRDYVAAGGLMSYGEGLSEFYRRAAGYVNKIFKGAKPAELPIEQPTRFFLVINLSTAKALGLEVPPALLARTDEVIE
jgi:putative tryptophan/tyrosine transport system substrate-binding protein